MKAIESLVCRDEVGQLDDAPFRCLALRNDPGDRLKEQTISVIYVDYKEVFRAFYCADAYWEHARGWAQPPKDVFDVAGMTQVNSSDQASKLALVTNLPDETFGENRLDSSGPGWDDEFNMRWIAPTFTRGRVNAAGETLVSTTQPTPAEMAETMAVINNWRSSHAYPLQALKMALVHRSRKVDERALVAQRLKRISSIARKLLRQNGMLLSRMHDLGGCRAVVRTVRHVDQIVKAYADSLAKNPNVRAEFVKKYDYIAEPKPDGYRSVHLVYKYRSRDPQRAVYNGLRIEIQIRSRLQHAWATAVETVDICTGQALKSNIGSPEWKRFFILMGDAIALRENRSRVPGTPKGKTKLVEEVRRLVRKLKILHVLGGMSAGVHMTKDMNTGDTYLLVLDTTTMRVTTTSYGPSDLRKASDDYMKIETESITKPEIQAVLVSVDSVRKLRTAYPSFYLDTRRFVEVVNEFIRR